MHKARCQFNQRANSMASGSLGQDYRELRGFCQKHRPALSDAVIRALDLVVDASRAETDMLTIVVCARPGSTRPETDFYATAVEVAPIDKWEETDEMQMRAQHKYATDLCRREGGLGAASVMICCLHPRIMNVIPVGFSQQCLEEIRPGEPWKEQLFSRMNEGIVL